MIPQSHIMEWSQQVPWQSNEQVEQDLIICRALVEIFSDKWLASSLAFRGGTALHKLYLQPQPRYSEDIDLVQVRAEPIKETVQRLQVALAFLGESSVKPRRDGTQIICRFDSEFPPSFRLRFANLGHHNKPSLLTQRCPREGRNAELRGREARFHTFKCDHDSTHSEGAAAPVTVTALRLGPCNATPG